MRLKFIAFIFLYFSLSTIAQNRHQLDSIKCLLEQTYDRDQQPRFFLLDSLEKEYAANSPQVIKYWVYINKQDSINRTIVTRILDTYGWPGANQTSAKANDALFMVIQHADIKMQIKYLPLVKNAITEGKLAPKKYAFLSDRIKMFTDRYQTYGTQIGGDYKGNLCFWPIEDEVNVNKRRIAMGLDSIQEYAKNFNIIYKAPAIDSLKGNVIITFSTGNKQHHSIASVDIYSSGGKFVGRTNVDGELRVIIPRPVLQLPFVFKKNGFKTSTFTEKEKGDVFIADIVMDKL